MTLNLWSTNTPERFWRLLIDLPIDLWQLSVEKALPELKLSLPHTDIEDILEAVLGEGQFGPEHWKLSKPKQIYYTLKPFLPVFLTRFMRRLYGTPGQKLDWPIEDRYVYFLWEVVRHFMLLSGAEKIPFINFWPDGYKFAFVITHDVETADGQLNIPKIANLEESLGFHSSFNIIPERYTPDRHLLQELTTRGFELGIHGLKHDGKLYSSRAIFDCRVKRINHYLKELNAVGFRSPLTHRQPYWMQDLEIQYDLSFFDTDPYEPIPGGTMNIWPFELGKFIELPYTLAQDNTQVNILKKKSSIHWLQKVDFLEKYHGMALINVHPDYLMKNEIWDIYVDFLQAMKIRSGYWQALPSEVAAWWRMRMYTESESSLSSATKSWIHLEGDHITLVS